MADDGKEREVPQPPDDGKEGEVTQPLDDGKEGEVTQPRGADWEVVQLTASTYAAAPGPEGFNPDDGKSRQESSNAMFMSDHFVFPPSEHENLPIVPDYSEIHSELEGQDKNSVEESTEADITHEERRQVKLDDDSQGIQFVDNGSTFSVRSLEFEEDDDLQELNPNTCPESTDFDESSDTSYQNLDSPSNYRKMTKEDENDGSGLPCGAWWKRHATSLYRHAKEANTFWSIFVAAALTGLVILGKRWQRDKWHIHANDERMSRVLGPLGRFKGIIVANHQRNPLTGDSAAARG